MYRDIREIELSSAEIPQGFNNIRAPFNTFIINGITYTVPPGNYTLTTLLSTMSILSGYTFSVVSNQIVISNNNIIFSVLHGTGVDIGNSVTVDSSGNIIVTGYYTSSGTVPVNNLALNSTPQASGYTLPAASSGSIYILKYTPSGVLSMFTTMPQYGNNNNSLVTDRSGNIFVNGSYYSSRSSFVINKLDLNSSLTPTAYKIPAGFGSWIIKWSSTGDVLGFTANPNNNGIPICNSMTIDNSGNLIITGVINDNSPSKIYNIALNNSLIDSTYTFYGTSVVSAFILKYKPDGTVSGFTSMQQYITIGNSVITDSSGNMIVTGIYTLSSSFAINNLALTTTPQASGYTLPATTSQSMFIIVYNSSGTVTKFGVLQGDSYDSANSVTVDSSGNIIVTGYYTSSGTVPVNNLALNSTPQASGYTLPATTSQSMFIIVYNSSGIVTKFGVLQGISGDVGNSVTVDSSGNIIVTGYYISSGTVPVNNLALNSTPQASGYTLPATNGNSTMFIIVYNSSGTVTKFGVLQGTNSGVSGNSVTVDSSGNIIVTGYYVSSVTVPVNNLALNSTPQASGYTLPASTGQDMFIIKYPSPLSLPLSVNTNSLLSLLGFVNGQSSATATNPYMFPIDDYLNIWIENVGTSSQEPQQITYKIPVTPGTIYWTNNNINKQIVKNRNYDFPFSKMNIFVLDRFGNQLDNNGQDWSFSIKI
jgi:hypothetical protein